ncbi:MAG: hypothetical protein R3E77_11295 [Steroidobacteraceae bacterium]
MNARKKRARGVPRSLFKKSARSKKSIETEEQWREWFQASNPTNGVEDALGVMLAAAARAEIDHELECGQDWADEIRSRVLRLNEARARAAGRGDSDEVALCAMKLTESWMMLRADALFARDIREKERRIKQSSALSDDDILAVVAKFRTQLLAAEQLGISERQVRTRVKRARDRKS